MYLTGDNPGLLERTAHQVLAEMRALNEVCDSRIKGDMPRPEIVIHPRLDIAAELGVSVQSISQTIRIATLGDLPQNGASVPLKTVADLSFGEGPSAVRRYNQSRRMFLEADLSPGTELGNATKRIYALPTVTHLPPGVHRVATGQAEFMGELFNNFLLAIAAGVLMVLAVLVLRSRCPWSSAY